MATKNRNDWWLMAALAVGVSAGLGAGLYWIGAPSLLIVLFCALLKVS
ncbi:MAG TPA: hypothetical protein VML19_18430 [Verrucomicrobiae bacterium]|nr:hypothetical protein [Verrucomicrobiae bacterium]